MRIQYTERDKHLIVELCDAAEFWESDSPLAKILRIAIDYDGANKDTVSIVSVKCSRCGADVFGVNPCRDEIEATGWCGCKAGQE